MSVLLRYYYSVYTKLKKMGDSLTFAYHSLDTAQQCFLSSVVEANNALQENLKENISKVSRVNAFISIAKTHTTHLKMSPLEIAYDNGKLSRIAVQVNSNLQDDPYATKLYEEATGQLQYLYQEKSKIEQSSAEKIKSLEYDFTQKKLYLDSRIKEAETSVSAYVNSDEFSELIILIRQDKAIFNSLEGDSFFESDLYGNVSIGFMKLPFPLPQSVSSCISDKTKDFYDIMTNTIRIPASVSIRTGSVIIADYENTSESTILEGIQNFIINIARYYSNDYTQVCFIDPIRFNSSSLGCLSQLCGNQGSFIDVVPSSIEDVRKKLKSIITEINIREVHSTSRTMRMETKALYVFHNFPQGYDANLVTQIQQLCVNAKYFGATVILTYNKSLNNFTSSDTLKFLRSIATNIGLDSFFDVSKDGPSPFEWYRASKKLPLDIERKLIHDRPVIDLSNDYTKRVGFSTKLAYKKGERKLRDIPFGIDEKGALQTLDFENSNFATFICGAARSGKSTLLHTLISGFIQNNHPDDIEIWLIDFKMTEFSRYIDHLPPHVRYIILDESPELVYDIIDRLTEILVKRQNIFKGKWQKLGDVPSDKYMPGIMVIIDEFSVMSQIVADSIVSSKENYAIKLQMLLAKGSALGLHFIFASQGFTSGTRGLNDFSKKQVQQRIAMKTEYSEIKDTIDLKSASDNDKVLMEQLPVHFAITRIPTDERGNHLKQSQVLNISDYIAQENMIDAIKDNFRSMPKYDVNDNSALINKKPMIIDGSMYSSFSSKKEEILGCLKTNLEILQDADEFALFIGEPRRMMSIYPVRVSNEFCENILMVSPSSEKMPACSIILSIADSLKMQNQKIEIWTNKKNSIYRQLKIQGHKEFGYKIDLDCICERIRAIKNAIQEKKETNYFFVLLGFESILTDMSYQNVFSMEQGNTSVARQTTYEKRAADEPDLNTLLEFLSNSNTPVGNDALKIMKFDEGSSSDMDAKLAYDAREDLKYILTNGPRLGYHFIIQFGTVGDVSQSKLDNTLFKHKIMFRNAKNDASLIMGANNSAVVADLQDHSFRYSNGLDNLSFRPFLHPGLSWDGWQISENGVINTIEEEEYLL